MPLQFRGTDTAFGTVRAVDVLLDVGARYSLRSCVNEYIASALRGESPGLA